MLLLHQTGSVKIGEVVRYTVTYTPAHDRILPSPSKLYLKIKNTTAVALRAAFVHGPYTIYVAAYPATFNPNKKFENARREGIPEFEPQLKAGSSFSTELLVPEEVRATAGSADRHGHNSGRVGEIKSASWIIEVASQVIFSTSAAVHYEILLGRDEKSLSLGIGNALAVGTGAPVPGNVSDNQQSLGAKDGHHKAQKRGVYSKAIVLKVEDTASLWNTPRMPEWDDRGKEKAEAGTKDDSEDSVAEPRNNADVRQIPEKQKKVHLVVLTHGLHSNLGADMLFLKESIDATAKQAKLDAKARRAKRREGKQRAASLGHSQEQGQDNELKTADGARKPPSKKLEDNTDEDEDEEEIIVRGFSGNAVRTERGIKYLGKRLAKYVLAMTYPDQPFRPITKKSASEALSHALRPEISRTMTTGEGKPAHHGSLIEKEPYQGKQLPYKITSISFIGHSLGGLIQTYAIAYIQKHSPLFFDIIQPINFIAMASPFLGLSNENPLYVKFALDFGLVGRTGKDLGLTWRAPTLARSGWGAIVGGIGESASKKIEGNVAPESKPLLRILPTGPAHTVLKKFRNRTVYSNVVNDGIVPLRTSCLLFLDWSGLGRVEKARRENGLVGTIAGWGWAEVTGQNSSSPMRRDFSETGSSDANETGENTATRHGHGGDVPQPPPYATEEDDARSLKSLENDCPRSAGLSSAGDHSDVPGEVSSLNNNPFTSFVNFFRPNSAPKQHNDHPKHTKIYRRSQTLKIGSDSSVSSRSKQDPTPARGRSKATTGDFDHEDFDRMSAPPKTTFFESAGDLLKPPLPSVQFLVDPASRPRTIFHDRVYHPEDIPPPPLKKRSTSSLLRRHSALSGRDEVPIPGVKHADSILSSRDYDDTKHTNPDKDPHEVVDGSAMKVEEKIARAYHRDLSWRKVLVRLEPDAHNNMIVRRMFANAYGWPVVKHLCDTHFSDAAVATTRDDEEGNEERAKASNEGPDADGDEMKDHGRGPVKMTSVRDRADSENREANDSVPALQPAPKPGSLGLALAGHGISIRKYSYSRANDESEWSERDWADSEIDSEEEEQAEVKTGGWDWTEAIAGKGATSPKGTNKAEVDRFLGRSRQDGTEDEDDEVRQSNAAAARVLRDAAAGMGIGLGQLSIDS
jgi:hypothetical protein